MLMELKDGSIITPRTVTLVFFRAVGKCSTSRSNISQLAPKSKNSKRASKMLNRPFPGGTAVTEHSKP